MTPADREALARKRVKEKKEFYQHLGTYLSVGVFFVVLNLLTSPNHLWFYWPMLGWGLGIVGHYFQVFGMPGNMAGSSAWEERELAKERRRLGANEPAPSPSPNSIDMDDHLELKEMPAGKLREKEFRREDLV